MNTSVPSSAQRLPAPEPLRVVVDANIALAMFLVQRSHPSRQSAKRVLIPLLASSTFQWLWTPDILADYERGAQAIEQDTKIQRKAAFDRLGFELFLAALQMFPAVTVSATALHAARQRIRQASRSRDRDLDDAIYLACAVDGQARLLTSEDSDLLNVGATYETIQIVNWERFAEELRQYQLIP